MRRSRSFGASWVVCVVQVAGCAAGPAALPLVTDRPDFTESAVAVEPGRVQVEGGYTYTESDGEGATHTVGEVLARVGLVPGLEARIGLNSVAVRDVGGDRESALEDASLGVKLVVLGEGSPVSAAVIAGSTVPTGQRPVGGGPAVPGLTLAVSRELGTGMGLGGSVGAEWPEDGRGSRYADVGASLALGLGVTERTGVFVEAYGFAAPVRGGGNRLWFDGGVTRQLGADLQVDGRVGGGAGGWFVGVGVVRRW